jgi:hypothetical protein
MVTVVGRVVEQIGRWVVVHTYVVRRSGSGWEYVRGIERDGRTDLLDVCWCSELVWAVGMADRALAERQQGQPG